MSSQTDKHIHYSDNDWNEIVTKFNLNNNIEVVKNMRLPVKYSKKRLHITSVTAVEKAANANFKRSVNVECRTIPE